MADKIRIRRGNKAQLPTLDDGEFGYCEDTKELFIGTTSGNVQIPIKDSKIAQILSGGYKLQTGQSSFPVTASGFTSIGTVTLPSAFASSSFVVIASAGSNGGVISNIQGLPNSATQFTMYGTPSASGTVGVNWIAVGT